MPTAESFLSDIEAPAAPKKSAESFLSDIALPEPKEKGQVMVGLGGARRVTPTEKLESLKAAGRGILNLGLSGFGALDVLGITTPKEREQAYERAGLGKTPEQYKPVEQFVEIAAPLAMPAGAGKPVVKATEKAVEEIPAALSRVEKMIAPATSTSKVGEKIEKSLTNRLQGLLKSRREQFNTVKNEYFQAGATKENEILNDYKNLLQNVFAHGAASGSREEQKLAETLFDRIKDRPVSMEDKTIGSVPPNFEALEKERRYLNDIANGLKIEGFEGISADFARNMAKQLESIIGKYVPNEFSNFKQTYTALSEPINQYNRAVGAQVVKRADEYLPDISAIDPAKLPDKFFQSRRSVNDLRALSGDEQFVQQMAREHIAVELRGAKSSKEVSDYIAKNYDWLQEFPQIRSDLETIASKEQGKELAKTIAKWGAGALAAGLGLRGISGL